MAVPLLSAAPGDDAELGRVLETMPAAFCFYDREWRFQRVNAAAERLLGRPRDEVLGRVLWDLWPSAAGSVYDTAFAQALATGTPVTFEAAAATGGGRLVRGARLALARRAGGLVARRHRPAAGARTPPAGPPTG